MTQVQAGDIIFSFVKQEICSFATATSSAYDAPQPSELFATDLWEQNGWRVDASYQELQPPLKISDLLAELRPLLPPSRSPLTVKGTGVQGYLFDLPPAAGCLLLDRIDRTRGGVHMAAPADEQIVDALNTSDLPETERRALVLSRVGQGRFRDDLLSYWGAACAVTGLDVPKLLRASHIKPWRDANNAERLDLFNGLLLSPAYDAAFDLGFISFRDDGMVLTSSSLTDAHMARLGIDRNSCLSRLSDRHRAYLDFHRYCKLIR